MTSLRSIIAAVVAAFCWSEATAQICGPTCTPNTGYPWPVCGCLNATDLNAAIASRVPVGGVNSGIAVPLLLYDNKTGAISGDAAVVGAYSQSGITSQQIYNTAVSSPSPTNFQSYDAMRGIGVAPSGSTVNLVTGVAGYTQNNTVPTGQRTQTAAVLAVADCVVNSSNCWGFNSIVSDNVPGSSGVTTGTGKFLYNEFDLNITSANSQGAGMVVGGTAFPTSVTLNFNAFAVTKLWGSGGVGTGSALWAGGLVLADACCAIGLELGAMATSGASSDSMPIYMNYRGADSSYQNGTFQVLPGSGNAGTMFLNGTGSAMNLDLVKGSIYLPANSNISFNNNAALTSDGTSTINLGNGAPWTGLGLGTSSTTVTMAGSVSMGGVGTSTSINSGTTVLNNAATGTPVASLCLDASNHIIKKTTAGSCI